MAETPARARPYDLDRVVRLVLTVGGALALFLLVRYLADVLLPFAVAVLLAYLLDPLVRAIDTRTKHRTAAVIVTVVGLVALLFALFVVVGFLVTSELAEFAGLVEQLRDAGSEKAQRWQAAIEGQEHPTLRFLLEYLKTSLEGDPSRFIGPIAQRVAPGVLSVLSGVAAVITWLSGLIVVGLYLVFLLIDYRSFQTDWPALLPPKYRDDIVKFVGEFRLAMSQYFRGQFIIASLTGILFAAGFSIVGLRLGVLLGLFVGVLSMVPYLQAVGLVPALILAVLKAAEAGGGILPSMIAVLAVFGIVQLIQDTLLTPRIMGEATGLRPVVVLLGVFIWAKLLGFLGLVLAIPLTCLGWAYYRRLVLGRVEAISAKRAAMPPPPLSSAGEGA